MLSDPLFNFNFNRIKVLRAINRNAASKCHNIISNRNEFGATIFDDNREDGTLIQIELVSHLTENCGFVLLMSPRIYMIVLLCF